MRKSSSIGAFAAIAVSLCAAQAANAGGVVTFEDQAAAAGDAYSTTADNFVEGGLGFATGQAWFVPPTNPLVKRPLSPDGLFMETYLQGADTTLATLTLDGGGTFDLSSLWLGLGLGNSSSLDSVEITGTQAACNGGPPCTVSTLVQVGPRFSLFNLAGFTGLTSVSFGPQTIGSDGKGANDTGFLAFDNISYGTAGSPAPPGVPAAVPEPAAWALMILGFGGIGAMLRRNRHAGFAAA